MLILSKRQKSLNVSCHTVVHMLEIWEWNFCRGYKIECDILSTMVLKNKKAPKRENKKPNCSEWLALSHRITVIFPPFASFELSKFSSLRIIFILWERNRILKNGEVHIRDKISENPNRYSGVSLVTLVPPQQEEPKKSQSLFWIKPSPDPYDWYSHNEIYRAGCLWHYGYMCNWECGALWSQPF